MSLIARILGRRDVKVFLLLLIPCGWAWWLCFSTPDLDWPYAFGAAFSFIAAILGPGLVLLGTASGADQHDATRDPGIRFRLRGEILCLGLSAAAGLALIDVGITATYLGFDLAGNLPPLGIGRAPLSLWSMYSFYPPGGLFGRYTQATLDWLQWDPSILLAGSWLGWIIGYRLGRRWGRFLPTLLVAAVVSAGIGYLLSLGTQIRFHTRQAPSPASAGFDPARSYSAAFLIDATFLLVAVLAVDHFLAVWLERSSRGAKAMYRWATALALWLILFIGYRSAFLHRIYPWPPPADSIQGLDPASGRLWVRLRLNLWDWRFYALDYPGGVHLERNEAVQVLHEDESIRWECQSIFYDPVAPTFLVWDWRETSSPMNVQCRTKEGLDRFQLPDGGWVPSLFHLRTPEGAWYAFASRDYEAVNVERTQGQRYRQFRSRLLLYNPRTRERRTVVTYPKGDPKNISWDRAASAYCLWPAAEWAEHEAVPVMPAPNSRTDEMAQLVADTFLADGEFDMRDDQPIFAHRYPIGLVRRELYFEIAPPRSDGNTQKTPAPTGRRGCIWARKDGTIRVYEAGKPKGSAISDASSETTPAWSPDGEFLVYLSRPAGATQCAVKLAYPRQQELLRTPDEDEPEVAWAHDSSLFVVTEDLWNESAQLTVFEPPHFSWNALTSHSYPARFQILHDGTVAYTDNGKVYIRRPEWKDPVCLYDPAKKTVLK